MKKIIVYFLQTLVVLALFFCTIDCYEKAITYTLNPGRFGDHVLTYAKTKWISWNYDIPLLYESFSYADQLQFSLYEIKKTKQSLHSFTRIKHVKSEADFDKILNQNMLYISDLKFNCPELKGFNYLYRYVVQNQDFSQELRRLISPINPLELIYPPKDMVSIAVHVRKGGGFDHPLISVQYSGQKKQNIKSRYFADVLYPQRFPPEQYYIDQIKQLSELFNDQPLFVHIFTDDPHPKSIVKRFKQSLKNPNITYSCREENNKHDAYVLEDLFSMAQFDCLIRPASSYSKVAQLIGNHNIIIYPITVEWKGPVLIVSKIGIIQRAKDKVTYAKIKR